MAKKVNVKLYFFSLYAYVLVKIISNILYMSSIFAKIINREIPAAIIYEDESYIAFMDAFPQVQGHVLVCPKKQVDYIFDLNENVYVGLFLLVKKLAPALKKVTKAKRICLQVEGYGVPHVHVHMLPTVGPLHVIGGQSDIDELNLIAQSIVNVIT